VPRAMLIDTDTASDDAVALIMASRQPDVEIKAVTIVAGNVPVDQGVRNALYTLELCGSEAPVYRGSAEPLRRPLVTAQFFHGGDGLGDRGYPPPQRSPAEGDAVEAIVRTVRENPGLVLVTLGPLTNLARALEIVPDLASRVGRCVVMGGAACTVGNVTPAAEFNLWVDPDAARVVFESGMPIEMVGWELCRHEANLDEAKATGGYRDHAKNCRTRKGEQHQRGSRASPNGHQCGDEDQVIEHPVRHSRDERLPPPLAKRGNDLVALFEEALRCRMPVLVESLRCPSDNLLDESSNPQQRSVPLHNDHDGSEHEEEEDE